MEIFRYIFDSKYREKVSSEFTQQVITLSDEAEKSVNDAYNQTDQNVDNGNKY
ncbi:hypothetical protein V6B95_06915 [Thermoanaerobacterium saccharolyticum]|uniref:hypothetical protein n=1 Tax=Thermoanaerobacterium saccharolyticum TaxID=28896 RepID=UPI000A78889D